MSNRLLGLIGSLTTMKVIRWAKGSDGASIMEEDDREPASILEGANVVMSRRESGWGRDAKVHAVLLDLDVEHFYVPSSSEGHGHLYVNVFANEADYFELLDLLAKVGVLQKNYVEASKKKGGTFLRLPWVKKEGVAA